MTRVTFDDLSYKTDGVWDGKGPFTGTAYETWPDGTPHSEQDFLWGHKDGRGREWNRAGRLVDETSFKEGVADGASRGWHDNGRLAYEHVSESGVVLSTKRWDETGILVEERAIDARSPDFTRVLKFREDAIARVHHRALTRWLCPRDASRRRPS